MKIKNIFLIMMISATSVHAWSKTKTQAYTNEIIAVMQDQNGPEIIVTFAFTHDPICTYTPNVRDVDSVKRYFMPLVQPFNSYMLHSLQEVYSVLFDMQIQQCEGQMPGTEVVFTMAQGVHMRKVINHSTNNVHFIFRKELN